MPCPVSFVFVVPVKDKEGVHMARGAPEDPGNIGPAKPDMPPHRGRRILASGCLVLLMVSCVGVGMLAVALRAGPVAIALPGNNLLKVGSDDFVLSNYSFQ